MGGIVLLLRPASAANEHDDGDTIGDDGQPSENQQPANGQKAHLARRADRAEPGHEMSKLKIRV